MSPSVRVIVRLPYNRPDQPTADPPRVEWNAEKADILWKVIARSRASDSGGTDWKGLAEHLEVPLPYLLYRAQTRYEEDLRGLQEIRDALSPTITQPTRPPEDTISPEQPTSPVGKTSSRLAGNITRLSNSARLTTSLGVRARLNSLSNNPSRAKKASSSSILTVQDATKTYSPSMRQTSLSSSEEETDSEDEEAVKEEEADKKFQEQEALDRKLEDLQKMMTNDTLGLVSSSRAKAKAREVNRGRVVVPASSIPPPANTKGGEPRSRSASQSVSSTSSPQGSIPSIPSPPPGSQPHSPISRRLSSSKSSSPPAVSPRSVHGLRYAPLIGRSVSEQDSNQGSEASSFSDISDTSLSASALESALLSNIRGTGSKFSTFARSRFGGRGGGVHL